VAKYISTAATYKLEYDPMLDEETNMVIAFLSKYKEGLCRHYASAATLLFRCLGIPARYTVGYVANTEGGKITQVTSKTAHAWVEVYLDGMGWIKVEVTGGGSSVPAPSPSPDNVKKPTIITLSPEYEHKMYDGEPLVPSGNIIYSSSLEELLAEGYTYQVKVEGSQTKIGRGVSTVTSFELFDPSGEKVYSSVENFDDVNAVHIIRTVLFSDFEGSFKVEDKFP
jgi:transglutaminase-like putative cysteine protease